MLIMPPVAPHSLPRALATTASLITTEALLNSNCRRTALSYTVRTYRDGTQLTVEQPVGLTTELTFLTIGHDGGVATLKLQ